MSTTRLSTTLHATTYTATGSQLYGVESECNPSIGGFWTITPQITGSDSTLYTVTIDGTATYSGVNLIHLSESYYAVTRPDGECLIVGGNCAGNYFQFHRWPNDPHGLCGLSGNYQGARSGDWASTSQASLQFTPGQDASFAGCNLCVPLTYTAAQHYSTT